MSSSFAPPTPQKSFSSIAPDLDQHRQPYISSNHADVYQSNHSSLPQRTFYLHVKVTSIEKAKNDILVRLNAHTNLSHFRSGSYPGVVRSYRQLCLYSLALSLSTPATIIPALPLPSTTASGLQDTRILRMMLSRWFSRVLSQPVLRDHPETSNLIEADFAYSPTPPGAGSSSAARKRFANAIASAASVAYGGVDPTGGLPNGVLATSASIGSRVGSASSFGSLFGLGGSSKGLSTSRSVYDDDEALVNARAEVTRLEMQFADAAQSSEKVTHARRALLGALSDLSIKLNNLGAVEEVRPPSLKLGLPHTLKRSAQLSRNMVQLNDSLSSSELLTLGDAVAYQSINARAAKEAMLARNALVEEHHNAQKATIAKKREAEHLKSQRNLRADKVDDALEELQQAKRHEIALAQNLGQISTNLHASIKTHSRHAHQDLQQALLEHARTSLGYQKQMLNELRALKNQLYLKANVEPTHSISNPPTPHQLPYAHATVSARTSFEYTPSSSSSAAVAVASEPSSVTVSETLPSSSSTGISATLSKPPPPPPSPGSTTLSQNTTLTSPPQTPSRRISVNLNSHPASPQTHTTLRPNPWAASSASPNNKNNMTQSFYQPPPLLHSSPDSSTTSQSAAQLSQSMFVQHVSRNHVNPFASRFPTPSATLNSSGSANQSGTASGRSRISASEAAKSLAGTF